MGCDILGLIAGRDDEGDPRGSRLADGKMEGVAVAQAAIAVVGAFPANAHIRDGNVVARIGICACRGNPVDAADDLEWFPEPFLPTTRTAHSGAPGTTPTISSGSFGMSGPSSLAAIVPATWVHDRSGHNSGLLRGVPSSTPPTTLRSDLSSPIPVSRTATFTFTVPEPSPDCVLLESASIRSMPVGSSSTEMSPSSAMNATRGFIRSFATAASGSRTAKPFSACLYCDQEIPAERVRMRHRGRAVRARFEHDDVLTGSRSRRRFLAAASRRSGHSDRHTDQAQGNNTPQELHTSPPFVRRSRADYRP